jgi:hypothetical protein
MRRRLSLRVGLEQTAEKLVPDPVYDPRREGP